MKRTLVVVTAVALALAAGSGAAPRLAGSFVVLGESTEGLASAAVPNAAGQIAVPLEFSVRQTAPARRPSLAELQGLWQRAGEAYGIPWPVLAAINKIETNFGENMGPSSAGAVGWMQFMPDTWLRWGMDADGDGIADPWNAEDAIYAAARYLAAAGGASDLARAVFAYNHAQWYVDQVLALAQAYGLEGVAAPVPGIDSAALRAVEAEVVELTALLAEAEAVAQALAARETRLLELAERPVLLSDRLAARKRAVLAGVKTAGATSEVEQLREQLRQAEERLEAARSATVGTGLDSLLPAPTGYVFPVGGGPGLVSVGRDHHDYPAADIAAPLGSPVYSLADAQVVAAWPFPNGRCGIGASVRTGDGLTWTYCHLAVLDAAVVPGAVLGAGAPMGVVGSTGRSTGPHLHLQLQPAAAYPQSMPWFQAFAGTAFTWKGEPAPSGGPSSRVHPVFAVVDEDEAVEDEIVAFTR